MASVSGGHESRRSSGRGGWGGSWRARGLRPWHKLTDSELLCVNLALVDFLGCVCFYPLSLISSFHHAWLGGYATCVYYGLGCYILGLCGMFTIAAISVIRYIKTFHGALYGKTALAASGGSLCEIGRAHV